jgi:hypothetical protein
MSYLFNRKDAENKTKVLKTALIFWLLFYQEKVARRL